MKRLWPAIGNAALSRAVTPCLLGGFLLLYVGIAFGSDEPLAALMAVIRSSFLLLALLALIPANLAARLFREAALFLKRRRALAGKGDDAAGLFDDELLLPEHTGFGDHAGRLEALGYATRGTERSLAAWRGASLFPARFLLLLGALSLFGGIPLSLATRVSHREAVLEGEPLPGSRDLVRRIALKEERGLLLARSLDIEVAPEQGGSRHYGLYPPARHRGFYLYPRHLGVAPLVKFTAADLPGGFEGYVILSIYPPGKEDSLRIPGSPYRVLFRMAPDAADPYLTGRITLQFRLLKGDEQVLTGSAPIGGEAAGGGYRLAFPDSRRLVVTDFVRDPGVPLIWSAGVCFALALLCWLPVRLWFPRQEMLFLKTPGGVLACSRAEGGRRGHAGRFYELLDLMQPYRGGEGAAGRVRGL